MKSVYFTITLFFHFILVFTLKLLDSLYFLLAIMVVGIVAGLILLKGKAGFKDAGWGICYGSAVSLVFVVTFIIWLYYNFPK
jgi:hypothetical protein